MTRAALLLPILLLATPTLAEDFVRAKGPLSDAAFYRLITCGRPPGGTCQARPKRWPDALARDLTVTILPAVEPVQPARSAEVARALDAAIRQINGVGADLHLRRVPDNTPAPIRLSIRSPRIMAMISQGFGPENTPAGMVLFDPAEPDRITSANILISSDIPLTQTKSVVLEELTQSLGLAFDIRDKAYTRRSIFSQDQNSVTVLVGQDAAILRLHYPPPP